MINTLGVIQGVSGTKTVSEVFGGCCKNCDDDEPGSLATFFDTEDIADGFAAPWLPG